ncbi:hypothetical protein WR25_23837 [Diploscapter pachys]|uniref:C2H2-type domain-containing protein n=1 Tax=Diploscapter pachys TaxID=2018661 RepID=A0A2A2J831_9BILA|nr:hypothetical protein WR25_23837 [Diploscapter pachys]
MKEDQARLIYIPDSGKRAQLKKYIEQSRMMQFDERQRALQKVQTGGGMMQVQVPFPFAMIQPNLMLAHNHHMALKRPAFLDSVSDVKKQTLPPENAAPPLQSQNSAFRRINQTPKKSKIDLKEDDSPVEEDENGLEILDPDDEEYVPSGRGRKRPAKRGFGNHINSEEDALHCNVCDSMVYRCHKTLHVYKHLYERENICRYICSASNCGYKMYRRIDVVNHIRRQHKCEDMYTVVDTWDDNMDRIFQKAYKDYYSEERLARSDGNGAIEQEEELNNSRVTVEDSFGRRSETPLTNETSEASEKSPQIVARGIRSSSKHCSICNRDIEISVILKHVCSHMASSFGLFRYSCKSSGCSYQTPYRTSIVTHHKGSHPNERGTFIDNILKWTENKVRQISQQTFGDFDLVCERMPVSWRNHHLEESRDEEKDEGIVEENENVPLEQDNENENEQNRNGQELEVVGPTRECNICSKPISLEKSLDLINHFVIHFRDLHSVSRYSCNLCEFESVDKISVQKHGLASHGRGNCYTDNISKWDLTAVKETSGLCFGDPEFIFSKLPYDWFIPKGISDNNELTEQQA